MMFKKFCHLVSIAEIQIRQDSAKTDPRIFPLSFSSVIFKRQEWAWKQFL